MFTFIVQVIDFFAYGTIGLFLSFFIASWSVHIIKLIKARFYKTRVKRVLDTTEIKKGVGVILPVVDEDPLTFEEVLTSLIGALKGYRHKIVVIANGGNSHKNAQQAREFNLEVRTLADSSKRKAVYEGAQLLKDYPYIVILDSDTIVNNDSIIATLAEFSDERVYGVTPRHEVFGDSLMERVSNWLEDIRFNEVLKGQDGAVSCLPGRLLAIRQEALILAVEDLVKQKFLGAQCISGDDRFLTSWLLQRGYKTVYTDAAYVMTNAPKTLKNFIKQRLRWSRTSLRETLLSLSWGYKYPFMLFTVLSNVVLRWWFFIVVIHALLVLLGFYIQNHFIFELLPFANNLIFIAVGLFVGFVLSGFIRNIRHLWNYPEDIAILIPFLFITTFILTPVEWYGNLTLRESGWMTRKTD